ncbi:MAG: hypothetical protein E7650_03555 [Ruminococcaceae bacterium]|nr:hypothetical protein [Oscillospiraceae bacterium]
MKQRKTRAESFFGIHCDFHAKPSKGDTIGTDLKEEDIREICRTLKPDFIQIDCKGHPGWASYPTKLGNAMPHFVGDPLALWRRVTREEGVALYMHYSGVYDIKYCNEHPEACTMKPDGTLDEGTTRLDSKYVDELLIPQLCELAEVYDIDGVWIDGECWRVSPDYHPETLEKFEKKTDIDLGGRAPVTPEDPYFYEYMAYHRELFLAYMRHYVDTLHERFPKLQICSNWAFSDYMPEAVSVNVDYLSGDLDPKHSYHSARYAGRALAQQNFAWDLMSWNFRITIGDRNACISKHKTQIMQEAAAVIALGGAYQNYVMQNNDGSPQMHELRNLADLGEFVRARKDYCFRGKAVHQAALLLSNYDRIRQCTTRIYTRAGYKRVMGMTALLCDIGQSLEIISEHTLLKGTDAYKMIVVPELSYGLEKEVIDALLTYAKEGGALMLTGKRTCEVFAENGAPFTPSPLPEYFAPGEKAYDNGGDTGHDTSAALKHRNYVFTEDNKYYGALFSPTSPAAENATVLAEVAHTVTEKMQPLAITLPYGKGSITAIGFDIGSQYLEGAQYLHRSLIKNAADRLYTPLCRVERALGLVEIVCLEKDGKLMLQLVNGNGRHTDPTSVSEDFIPPVVDVKLSIALPRAPKKLVLQPAGRELAFTYENGRAYFEVDRVNIHDIVEVVE